MPALAEVVAERDDLRQQIAEVRADNAVLALDRNQLATSCNAVVGEDTQLRQAISTVSSSVRTLKPNQQELENINANNMNKIRLMVNAAMCAFEVRLAHDMQAYANAVDLRLVKIDRCGEVDFVVNPSVVKRYEARKSVAAVPLERIDLNPDCWEVIEHVLNVPVHPVRQWVPCTRTV